MSFANVTSPAAGAADWALRLTDIRRPNEAATCRLIRHVAFIADTSQSHPDSALQ